MPTIEYQRSEQLVNTPQKVTRISRRGIGYQGEWELSRRELKRRGGQAAGGFKVRPLRGSLAQKCRNITSSAGQGHNFYRQALGSTDDEVGTNRPEKNRMRREILTLVAHAWVPPHKQ